MTAAVLSGTLLTLSSNAWPLAWMGLELNLLGFLPLAMSGLHHKKSSMSYFIVQSIGSLLLLFAGLSGLSLVGISLAGALLKLGLVPLHFWVPPVAASLSRAGLGALLSWQKIAPFSLLICLAWDHSVLAGLNVVVGALMVLSASALAPFLVFSGLIQFAWVLSLRAGTQMWHYLALYFTSLLAVVAYYDRATSSSAVALLNAAGLPPMTGFMIKLRAILRMRTTTAVVLLLGSGAALCAYGRLALMSSLRWESPPAPLLAAVALGAV